MACWERLGVLPNEPENSKRNLFSNHLDTKILPSHLLQLHVAGMSSRNEAERFLRTVIEELKVTHARMTKQIIDNWHQELDEIGQVLKSISERINHARQSVPTPVNFNDKKVFTGSYMQSTLEG